MRKWTWVELYMMRIYQKIYLRCIWTLLMKPSSKLCQNRISNILIMKMSMYQQITY